MTCYADCGDGIIDIPEVKPLPSDSLFQNNPFSGVLASNCTVVAVCNCYMILTGNKISLELLAKLSYYAVAVYGSSIKTNELIEVLGMEANASGSTIDRFSGYPYLGSIGDPKYGSHSVTILSSQGDSFEVLSCSLTDNNNMIRKKDYMNICRGSPRPGTISWSSTNYFWHFDIVSHKTIEEIKRQVDSENNNYFKDDLDSPYWKEDWHNG